MRIPPAVFGLLVGLWGVALVLLGREGGAGGCALGSCPACGACLRPPPAAEASQEARIA